MGGPLMEAREEEREARPAPLRRHGRQRLHRLAGGARAAAARLRGDRAGGRGSRHGEPGGPPGQAARARSARRGQRAARPRRLRRGHPLRRLLRLLAPRPARLLPRQRGGDAQRAGGGARARLPQDRLHQQHGHALAGLPDRGSEGRAGRRGERPRPAPLPRTLQDVEGDGRGGGAARGGARPPGRDRASHQRARPGRPPAHAHRKPWWSTS